MTQEGASSNKRPLLCTTFRCTFAGGDDERGGFTGEQLIRYRCKLRRHICARCGMMHRGERDNRLYAGVRDDLLPPRKRSTFRRTRVFQLLQSLGGGGGSGVGDGEEKREAALPLEEAPSSWSGSAISKGKKRGPRRKRADLLCCELFKV